MVQFIIKDEAGIHHTITLKNVIYLSSVSKNLISASQWSRDKQDDCGVLSREKYKIFMWEHDSLRKLIDHKSGCAIPLIRVNEKTMHSYCLHPNMQPNSLTQIPFYLHSGIMTMIQRSQYMEKVQKQTNNLRMLPLPSVTRLQPCSWPATSSKLKLTICPPLPLSTRNTLLLMEPLDTKFAYSTRLQQ